MQKPLLSIVMITYMHENYIRQAIQGVFLQKSNFNIELIIVNDRSPDNSDEVIRSTIEKNQSHIDVKYTRHDNNLGMIRNFIWALQQAKGKYIAICEGDDYWIDPLKLQKQVDFLEANPEYSIHCHNFKTQNGDIISNDSNFDTLNPNASMTIVDLSKNNVIPTLTSVFRNQEIIFPTWTTHAPLGDIILFMQVARRGNIKYLNEKMAVYRQNVGIWSGQKMNQEKMVHLFENLASDYSDLPEVKRNLLQNRNKHIKALLKDQSFLKMFSNENFPKLNFVEKTKLIVQKFL